MIFRPGRTRQRGITASRRTQLAAKLCGMQFLWIHPCNCTGDGDICALKEDQQPLGRRAPLSKARGRSTEVRFQSVSRNFSCLSQVPRLLGSGKVSGKPQMNSLSHGISALPLLVLAKPRKCRGVLKSKMLEKKIRYQNVFPPTRKKPTFGYT